MEHERSKPDTQNIRGAATRGQQHAGKPLPLRCPYEIQA